MNKEVAQKLSQKAKEIAEMFSKEDRQQNFNKETFEVEKIMPLSEFTAAVIYLKSSGKKAVAFLYWMNADSYKEWRYFFPADSHILGMSAFGKIKINVEMENFDKN